MGTSSKLNAIWWNIKINLHKLVDICGYKLATNLQNFMQKDLTEVKIFLKFFWGYTFLNTVYTISSAGCKLSAELISIPSLLRPVYSDTTQLNSTSSWVELCRYKRAFTGQLGEGMAHTLRCDLVFSSSELNNLTFCTCVIRAIKFMCIRAFCRR